jgi:hypothetical protein
MITPAWTCHKMSLLRKLLLDWSFPRALVSNASMHFLLDETELVDEGSSASCLLMICESIAVSRKQPDRRKTNRSFY